MASSSNVNHMVYEVISIDGIPTLVPNDLSSSNGLTLAQPELQAIAYGCKNISPTQLSDTLQTGGCSIVHINARSLLRNYEDIVTFVDSQKYLIDFLLISESWMDPALQKGYAIQGYQMLHCIPDSSFHGKGCAIYIKNSIFPFCKQLDDLCRKQEEFQSLFIEVTWPNRPPFVVAAIYRSPSYSIDVFLPYLEQALNKLKELRRPSFLGGDWNMNLFHYSDRSDIRNFMDCLTSYGYSPTISIPTRISNIPPFTETLIDNIFCNIPDTVVTSATITTGIADHLAIFCNSSILNHTKNSGHGYAKPMFDFRRIEELKVKVAEKLANFTQVENPEMGANFFISAIQSEMAKLTINKSSRSWTPIQPWITPGLLRCIKKRSMLLKQFLRNRTLENESKYRKYRNMLRLIIRRSKKKYYADQFSRHANDPRRLWLNLREVTQTQKCKPKLPVQFDINGSLTEDQHVIAKEFNEYYSQVGPNLDSALGPCNIDPISYLADTMPLGTMSFLPVTPSCLLNVVHNLKETGAGVDGISAKLLKMLIPSITFEVTHLVNICLMKGVFPSIFKQALIIPIYKAGPRTTFSNYRPISILPVFSKVLETVMYMQLNDFVKHNNILYKHQFGFRSGHSTFMPVAILHDFITSNLIERNKSATIYLDLARAFDTVNIDILLKKLTKYGINGIAHSLIKSYLSQRTHRLRFNDIVSEEKDICCGVPQGSILGPLLFILYINDIHKACSETNMLLFADDTALLYAAPTLDELQSQITRSFPKICTWLHANRLSLSIPKTFYQLYLTHEDVQLKIPIMNTFLKRASTIKYLGLLVDDDLKFKSHIAKVTGTCSRILGILYRSSYFLNKNLLLLLYNALILPHMSYCAVIWGSNYETTLNPLVIMQKRAIRLISGAPPFSHTSPLYRELKLLKLTDLVKYHILLIMHDYLFARLPRPIAKFTLAETTRPSRKIVHFDDSVLGTSGVRVPNYRITNYRQFALFCRGPSLWNSLIAPKIPNLNDVPSSKGLFKKCIKILFFDTY